MFPHLLDSLEDFLKNSKDILCQHMIKILQHFLFQPSRVGLPL